MTGCAGSLSSPPSPGLLGIWLGGRSSWLLFQDGRRRGIRGFHGWAAWSRWRGVLNPIHAASMQGLGDKLHKATLNIWYNELTTPPPAKSNILQSYITGLICTPDTKRVSATSK